MAASGSSRCYAGAISFAEGSLAPRLKKDSSVAKSKKHKDVEFAVGDKYVDTFNEAAGLAVVRSAATGTTAFVDVLVSSKAGARWLMGDDGVEQYEEDPEASVFERVAVKAEYQGRVP